MSEIPLYPDEPIDWRARALAAERALAEAKDALHACAGDAHEVLLRRTKSVADTLARSILARCNALAGDARELAGKE